MLNPTQYFWNLLSKANSERTNQATSQQHAKKYHYINRSSFATNSTIQLSHSTMQNNITKHKKLKQSHKPTGLQLLLALSSTTLPQFITPDKVKSIREPFQLHETTLPLMPQWTSLLALLSCLAQPNVAGWLLTSQSTSAAAKLTPLFQQTHGCCLCGQKGAPAGRIRISSCCTT